MTRLRDLVRIYRALVGSRIRAQWQYRASFFLDATGTLAITAVDFLEILVIFHQVPQLRGWSLRQVAFLYGTSSVALSVADMAVGQFEDLPDHLRTGSFDQFLIRPLGSLFQILSSDFALRRMGRVMQALVVLAFALAANPIPWTVGRIVMIPIMVASAIVIFSAIYIVGSASTFWTIDTMEITNSFTYGGGMLASYPLNIYSPWMRRLVLFGIPLAFVNYMPALYVLDRPDPLHLPHLLRFASPLVAIVSALVAGAIWRTAVRHYRSTGS
jgi:ABC-2 type transport system permease protein